MKLRLSLAAGVITVSAGLLLGACSGSDDHDGMSSSDPASMDGAATSIPADASFNATDVGFAQGMIPHHGQAIEMAEMALDTTSNADVVRLATAIKAAQQPEIDQLTTWLEGWKQPVPDADMGADHDMGSTAGMMMSGMMSEADMERLGEASGSAFDRLWLEMMIQHHQGAIDMANDEIEDGKYADAKQMAQTIVTTQQAEIDEMEGLISGLAD
jgi:uncharacterized protein (DUF305 family)